MNCLIRVVRWRTSRSDGSRQEIRRALPGSLLVGNSVHRRHRIQSMSTIAPRLPMTLSASACPDSIALIDDRPAAAAAR